MRGIGAGRVGLGQRKTYRRPRMARAGSRQRGF